MADLDRSGFCRQFINAGWKKLVEKRCCPGRTGFANRHDSCRLYPADRYGQRPGRESDTCTGAGNHANACSYACANGGANGDSDTFAIAFSDAGPDDDTFAHTFARTFAVPHANAIAYAFPGA
jgi:hypothetical protein